MLLGRLQSVREGVLHFANDLAESLAYGDAAYCAFLDRVDNYVEQQGMKLPAEPAARVKHPDPLCVCAPLDRLDMRHVGLSSAIWATGYTFDFSWIDLPVLDARGEPKHDHGIAPLPGIYFLGLPWLSKMNSSFLSGVGDDTARLADCIRPPGRVTSKPRLCIDSRGSVPRRAPLQAIVLTAAAMLCFAANSILCRLALAPRLIDAATFTTLRVASAAAMLSLVIRLQRRQWPRPTQVGLLSALALFAYLAFFSFAYLRLDAGSGALILIGAVQFTMFSVSFYEGERFTRAQWAGLGLALLGFVYLVLPGVTAPDLFGAALMTMSGMGWGCFSLLARGAYDPVAANAGNFLWCLLPALIVNLLNVHDFAVVPAGLLLAGLSGAIATGFGYVVWYLALRDLPATQAATVQLSMPALVALGGTLLLSEPLTARLATASAAMLGGIALVLGQRAERSAA